MGFMKCHPIEVPACVPEKRLVHCGLFHEWEADVILIDRGFVHETGGRLFRLLRKYAWLVTPENCPHCGQPWTWVHARNQINKENKK